MRGRRVTTAVALAAAAVVTVAGPAPADAKPQPKPATGTQTCQVRILSLPPGAVEGNVMDIEHVPGRGVVYYGSYHAPDDEGIERQRAVVWFGLDGTPVPVGPADAVTSIAYELTWKGLINGESLDDTGQWRSWVQNLRTGRVTYVEYPVVDGAPAFAFVRRINDKGDMAGSISPADGVVRAARWAGIGKDPVVLTGDEWEFAEALGINDAGDAVGAVWMPVSGESFSAPIPVLWTADGETVVMATLGIDAYPRLINDAGHAAGVVGVGEDFPSAHGEAAFWPTPEEVVPLGILPGGDWSEAYGLSEGGWVVGNMNHHDPGNPDADEWNLTWHSFLWTGGDTVRVLPSPYAIEQGSTDWHQWYGGAAHAVNDALNQVGTNAHGGYLDDERLLMVPTVYLNADTCGTAVQTTHTPFWLHVG